MNRFRGRIVDNPGGTFNIDEDVEVVILTTTDSDPMFLPSVTASGSKVGVGWKVEIQDPDLLANNLTIYPNASDSGFLINGNAFFLIPGTAHSLTVTYQGDGLWQVVGYTPAGSGYIYNHTAYVHSDGDDTNGVVGDWGKPFASLLGAINGTFPNGLQDPGGGLVKNAKVHVKNNEHTVIDYANPYPAVAASYYEGGWLPLDGPTQQLHIHLDPGVRIRVSLNVEGAKSFFSLNNGARLWITSEDRNSGFEVVQGGLGGDIPNCWTRFAEVGVNSELRCENMSIYGDTPDTGGVSTLVVTKQEVTINDKSSSLYFKNVMMVQEEKYLSDNNIAPATIFFAELEGNIAEFIDCEYYRKTRLYDNGFTKVGFAYIAGGGSSSIDNGGRQTITIKNMNMEMYGEYETLSSPDNVSVFWLLPQENINQTGGIWMTFSNSHFRWSQENWDWDQFPSWFFTISPAFLRTVNIGGLSLSRTNWTQYSNNNPLLITTAASTLSDVIRIIASGLAFKRWRNTIYTW